MAEILSVLFTSWGASPVTRIPVLGRTGPDISINELGWIIDVKSRLSVSNLVLRPGITHYRNWEGIALKDISNYASLPTADLDKSSIVVDRWFDHMDEWRKKYFKSGRTVLILHRPKMPVGNSIIITNRVEELLCKKSSLINPVTALFSTMP